MNSSSQTGPPSGPSPSEEVTRGLSTVGALSHDGAGGGLRCPNCHNPLERSGQNPAEAVCPTCSSTFQVCDVPLAAAAGEQGRLGKFQLLERRGAGAFGVVWRARDLELDRLVALKIPHPGVAASPRDLERFQREARAAAQLRHPGIVSVHEVALVAGQPAIVSDFIDGLTLRELLALRPLTFREAAELTAQIAEALDYAHGKGLVHRDIKPANIMIELGPGGSAGMPLDRPAQSSSGAGPRPLLMDFGLALREEAEVTLTVEGQIVGTPAYMSPEQAGGGGHQVDGRSDVYALGVVLYELLTGELPFRGSRNMMVHQVLHEEPRPPRQVNDKVPRDLETICLKCLQKSPSRRYATARDLADDLRRWQHGEPIQARPVGRAEKLWRWCRRHPAPTTAAAVIVATVALAFILIARSRSDALQARDDAVRLADEKADLARNNARLADQQTQQAEQNARLAQQERELREKVQRGSATSTLRQGLYFCERGDVGRGLLHLAASLDLARQARAPDLEQAGRTQLALWRSHVTSLRMLLPHDDEVLAVAFSPDGRLVLTGGADRTTRLWDPLTGKPVGEPFRLPPQPERPRPGPAGPEPPSPPRHAGELVAVAFRPDGAAIAAAPGDPSYRGRAQLAEDVQLRPHGLSLTPGTLGSPLGRPAGLEKRSAPPLLWEKATAKLLGSAPRGEPVWAVAYSPDGRRMVTGGGSYQKREGVLGEPRPWDPLGATPAGWAQVWDARTGQPLPLSLPHDNAVLAVAYSPDGRHILTGSADHTARLWDAQTGQPVGRRIPHEGPVLAVAFSPDGQTFLTCSQTTTARGTVQLWAANSGAALGPPLLHPTPVLAAAFSPDGRLVLAGCGRSAANRGEARLWDAGTGRQVGQPLPHPGAVHAVAWSPDGRWILTGCADRLARLWEAIPSPALVQRGQHDNAIAYSPDGLLVVVAGPARDRNSSGPVSLAETSAARPMPSFAKEATGLAAFSPDGRTLALAVKKERHVNTSLIHRVDAASSQLRGPPIEAPAALEALAVSNDGTVLTGSSKPYEHHGEAVLWDGTTGKRLYTFLFEEPVLTVAFSPDGRLAATGSGMPGSDRGEARLYDVAGGRLLKALPHSGPIRVVHFSPDGTLLATAGDDRTVRLWSAATGKPRGPALAHNGSVRALAFSADSKLLLTGSDDQTARLWEVATGKTRGDVLTHRAAVRAVAIHGEGHLLLTGSDDQTAQVWEAATGRPLGEPLPHSGPVVSVAFAGPRTVLTRSARTNSVTRRRVGDAWESSPGLGWDCIGKMWTLPAPVEGDADTVLCWAEVLTGLTLDANGQPQPLQAKEWRERRRQLGGRADLGPSEETVRAWHRSEARAAEAAGQWLAAAWHLERLGNSEPASERVQARLGKAHVLAGRWSEALHELQAAMEQDPTAVELRYFRGLAHAELHHDDEALADYTAAIRHLQNIKQEREAWIVWFQRARLHFHRKEMDKAIADLSTVLKLKPDHGPSWHGRGMAHAELGHLEQAAADFLSARQRPDAPATAACDLAVVRLRLGDRDGYRQACAYALERLDRTDDPLLIATVVWTCCLGPGVMAEPQQLVNRIGRAVLENRGSFPCQRALAAAFYRAGKLDQAVRASSFALSLRKEPAPSVWLILALTHQRLKHMREAGDWLERASRWIEEARQTKPGAEEPNGAVSWEKVPWSERMALEILQQEAQAGRKEKAKD